VADEGAAADEVPGDRASARERYESRLRALREKTFRDPEGVARRVKRSDYKFRPNAGCLVCASFFEECEHTEQDNLWAIAVVRWNQAQV
jgi:hypothetical protein